MRFRLSAEFWDLAPHHAPGAIVRIEDGDLVSDRGEIARDSQRRWACADTADPLAVALRRGFREPIGNVALAVSGDTFQPADGDRLFLQASAPAGWLAWPVARAPEDSGKDVRLPVDQISPVVIPVGDAPDIFRNWRMGRAGPLAINHFVEVIGMRKVSRLGKVSSTHKFSRLHDASISPLSPTGAHRKGLARIQSRFPPESREIDDKLILTLGNFLSFPTNLQRAQGGIRSMRRVQSPFTEVLQGHFPIAPCEHTTPLPSSRYSA
jgi:hypothetical protein